MANEKRQIMTEQEAIAQAEQELSTSRYIAECTRSPGMKAIHNKRCSWLSVIVSLAKKALKADAVEVVHGRWMKGKYPGEYICSHCGLEYCEADPEEKPYKYCPECGSKNE